MSFAINSKRSPPWFGWTDFKARVLICSTYKNIYITYYTLYYILFIIFNVFYPQASIERPLRPSCHTSVWSQLGPQRSEWRPLKVSTIKIIFFLFCSVKDVIDILFCSTNMSFWPFSSKAPGGSIPGLKRLERSPMPWWTSNISLLAQRSFYELHGQEDLFSGKIGLRAGSVLEP